MAGTSSGCAYSRSMRSRARRRCARSASSSGVMATMVCEGRRAGDGLRRPRLRMLCRVQTQIAAPPAPRRGQRPHGRAVLAGAAASLWRRPRGSSGSGSWSPEHHWPQRVPSSLRSRSSASGWDGASFGSEVVASPFRVFAVGTVLLGAAAVWWTWAFAMPAAMRWDAGATPRALAALRGIGDVKSVCRNATTGAVVPLRAPFGQARTTARRGPRSNTWSCRAIRSSRPSGASSTATRPRPATSSDECTRHLVGGWYAVTDDPSGSIGYTCHGGG